jgi:hypothetical protein
MGPPTGNEPITLEDLKDDPMGSMQRIGAMIKRDVSDPKTWVAAAAMYFGPKVFKSLVPAVSQAAVKASVAARRGVAIAREVPVSDAVGIVSPRAGKAMEVAQRMRDAVTRASSAAPAEAGPVAPSPPAAPPPEAPAPSESAPSPAGKSPQQVLNEAALARRRAEYQARQAAPEAKLYRDLRDRGLTDQEARAMMTLMRGTLTDEQVAAEIAARKGNRSPKR